MMSTSFRTALILVAAASCPAAEPAGREPATPTSPPAATVEEARGRARLLHETLHGVLEIMHRDFFNPDDRSRIPSASLEDVFKALQEERGVQVRWLGVNAKTLNVDHAPHNKFEEAVVEAFSDGALEFESIEPGRYRYAGAIPLHNSCLKCHVPHRTSLEERVAAVVFSIPIGAKP